MWRIVYQGFGHAYENGLIKTKLVVTLSLVLLTVDQNNPGPGDKVHYYKLWTPMWWSPLKNFILGWRVDITEVRLGKDARL